MNNKKRVLAGMRASGKLHLGNYFGGTKGMLALQNNPSYETLYMVADLHAVTTPYDKTKLSESTRNVILDYLAAGLDPEKSIIFVQSHVSEHTELAYLFSSVMTIARMQHLPTFKEKVKQYPEGTTMALLNYPVLMAADILLYKANAVPVGIDQEPHLEVSREVARKMNAEYGTNFPEPVRFTIEGGEYVPSLTGEGKMSKSVEGSYIALTDDLETIKSKVAKIPTDSGKGHIKPFADKATYYSLQDYDKEHTVDQKGVFALLTLVELFAGKEKRKEYETMYDVDQGGEGVRYGVLKEELSEAIYQTIKPLQERRATYEQQPEKVDKILREGAEKARAIAKETIKEVKEKMGFIL